MPSAPISAAPPMSRGIAFSIVVLAAAAVHLQTLGFPFVFDDRYLVVLNAFLREAWSPIDAFAHDFWYGTPSGVAYYRPLVVASLALNGKLLGWGPAGFHLFNLLLHAASSALVLALLLRLAVPMRAAMFGALFFSVHPVTAWPFASIVARVDLLPAFFLLLAWLALAAGSAPAVGLAFLGALLCKESAVAFLGVPFLALRAPLAAAEEGSRRGGAPAARRATLLCGLAAAGAVAAAVALRRFAHVGLALSRSDIDGAVNPLGVMDDGGRTLAALRLAGRYLAYLLVPARFTDAAHYGRGEAGPPLSDPGVLFGALLLVLIGGLTLWLWWRRDRRSLFVGFALAAFLPASNLLTPIGSLYAQNFLYMPLLGLALAAGDTLGRWERRLGRLAAASATAVLVLMSAATMVEARIWRSGPVLFKAWTERFPNYGFGWAGLGTALNDEGDAVGAERTLRRSLALDDSNAKAHYNLGVTLLTTTTPPESGGTDADADRLREGLEHSRRAAAIEPRMAEAHINAARVLLLLGRPDEAEAEARAALAVRADLFARQTLAEAIFRQRRYADAVESYRELVPLLPGDPNLRAQYLESLVEAGDAAAARRDTEAARRDFPDLAWFDVCLARIEAREGHLDAARELLRRARSRDPQANAWIARFSELAPIATD